MVGHCVNCVFGCCCDRFLCQLCLDGRDILLSAVIVVLSQYFFFFVSSGDDLFFYMWCLVSSIPEGDMLSRQSCGRIISQCLGAEGRRRRGRDFPLSRWSVFRKHPALPRVDSRLRPSQSGWSAVSPSSRGKYLLRVCRPPLHWSRVIV